MNRVLGYPVANPDRLDSTEVYTADGELDGMALIERVDSTNDHRPHPPLTPTRCCRTCAWGDADRVVYMAGTGLVYLER